MAVDTRIPNIERIRDLQAAFTQEKFADKCGIARQTLRRIYEGQRSELDTLMAIAAAFDLDVEELLQPDLSSGRLCDRISRTRCWPDIADALRQIVITMGTSAQRTYTTDSRKLVSAGLSGVLLEQTRTGSLHKNPTIQADVDATMSGIQTADLFLKPIADRLGCGLNYLTEELAADESSFTPYLSQVAERAQGGAEFFKNSVNVLRLIADPLDGSMNHKRGVPFFSAAAALLVDDQPRVSAVFDPVQNIVYTAILAGPYSKPERQASATAWQISTGYAVDLTDPLPNLNPESLSLGGIALHLPRGDRDKRREMIALLDVLAEHFDSIYLFNAGVPAMVLVAKGGIVAFANPSTNLHDVAAAEVLCRATNCKVTDWDNKPIQYKSAEKISILAAKQQVHAEILTLLHPGSDFS